MLNAEAELEKVPAAQGVGVTLDEGHQFPGVQDRQFNWEEDPTTVENEPGGHALHVLKELEPVAVEKRPAGHKVGVFIPKFGQ
jgi:hypothetical protein